MYCLNCGTMLPDTALFCTKCGYQTIKPDTPNITAKEQSTTNHSHYDIKEYLSHAKELETNKLILTTAKERLQEKINSLGHDQHYEKPTANIFQPAKKAFFILFSIILIVGIVICAFVCNSDTGDGVIANIISIITIVMIFFNPELLAGIGITLGCAIGGGLIGAILVALFNIYLHKINIERYKAKIKINQLRVTDENQQIVSLQNQIRELDKEISYTENVLEKFYSVDIIYPKYRGLIPILTIYEYFESGRHTNLPDAYNKYEEELWHKTISDQLNIVISQLEQIKYNQAALYDAVCQSIDISERICHQNEILIESSKSIERNSEIIALNSKIAADNSTVVAYMNMLSL